MVAWWFGVDGDELGSGGGEFIGGEAVECAVSGVAVDGEADAVATAVRDSKLPTEGDFPHLLIDTATWAGFLTGIKSGDIA